jgi:hypothetical protein
LTSLQKNPANDVTLKLLRLTKENKENKMRRRKKKTKRGERQIFTTGDSKNCCSDGLQAMPAPHSFKGKLEAR